MTTSSNTEATSTPTPTPTNDTDTTTVTAEPDVAPVAEPVVATVNVKEAPKITRHVAVCAFPFGAHPSSLLQLVHRIAASAPSDVSVVFSFFSTASSNAALFSGSVPDNIQPRSVAIPEEEGDEKSPGKEVDRFLEGAPEALKVSVAEAEAEVGVEIGCVVADAFIWFSRAVAEEKSVPWVPFWTAGPASLSALVSTDLFRTKFGLEGIQGKEQESADLIPGFSSVLAGDLPHGVVAGDLNSTGSQTLYNAGLNVPKATAVSINSFQELDPMITHDLISKLPILLNVGPFPLTSPNTSSNDDHDEHACIAWLDHHKDNPSSVAYISFGTISVPSKDDITALAEALEATGAPFLWSIRKEVRDLLPEGFVERVVEKGNNKFVPWAPQVKVLGHQSVGVFVTHCGWNSVLESITSGVPMVCMPILHDQTLNCRFVDTVWKVGVRLDQVEDNSNNKVTKEGVEKALRKVLLSADEEEGKAIRESVRAFKEKAEEAVKSPDGSSYKDLQKMVEIVMGLSANNEKDTKKKEAHKGSWKKWFKVFKVWKR